MSAAPVLSQSKLLRIEVTAGPLRGKVFSLSKPTITIGRSSENDINLENDLKISRNHVEIRQVAGTISIQNMNERNTMMVNGQLVSFFPFHTAECTLRIGDSEFRISLDGVRMPAVQKPLYVPASVGAVSPPPVPQMATPNVVQHPRNQQFQYTQPKSFEKKESQVLFYALIGLLLVIGLWLFNSQSKKHKQIDLRTTDDIENDLSVSLESIRKLEAENKKSNKNDIQYQTAQQHYIKGFRDYKQGQYGRAILSLQAALAFYPQHELAQKYSILSRRKLDELVKFEMMTGLKYRGQGNYRLCASSYRKVLSMISDEKDSTSQEAASYLRECELLQKEKY